MLSTGTRLGPYEITAPLGAGGMGEVYRAADTNLKREVAIKVLPEAVATDPERLARFQREAEVLAALNHPNIAHIYGLERSGGTIALVMELVEGATLADRIAKGALPPAEALPLAKQIAEALEAAHEHGIIHRDLKPTNIKVRSDGRVKVLDFGLAKALEPTGASTARASMSPTLSLHATQAGIILGTAAYMSPEQAAGKPVDKRSDLWAFGVVLLEMLTGRQVFGGETVSHVLAAVLKDEPNWTKLPTNTPAPVRRLLRRCLEKDRTQRLADATDARLEIQDALVAPAADTSAVSTGPRRGHWGWIAASVLVGLVAASVAAGLYLRRPDDTAQTRFSIPMPTVGPFGSFPAVSPDGRRIAFVAQNSPSTTALFVRALDALDAQMLPGTEDAILPFWSPDSRSIGFGVQGQVKRIEVSGGPPQTVCDTPGLVLGGSWNTDGVIVFGSSPGPLKRVLASGGVPTDVTALEGPQGTHALPTFLPDGRHVLFVVSGSAQVQNPSIELASLDSKERVTVLKTASNFAYTPGYLLFHRNGTLMAQPFDASRFSLRGEPVRLADGLAFVQPSGVAEFAVSPSVLVYRTGTAGAQSRLTWYDRTRKPLGPVGTPGEYRGLALSPDGKRLAVHLHQPPNGGDIWVLDQDRGTFQKFTLHASHNFLPMWSRDGSMMAFSSDRDGGVFNLYQKSSSGAGNDELVLRSPNNKYPEDWAPDGQALLYGEIVNGGQPRVMVLPLSGERTPKPFENTAFPQLLSKWSPDGRWIAYVSLESGRAEVYVQPYPQRSGKWQISSQGGHYPRWARSGRELFYLTEDGTVMAVDVRTDGPAFGAGTPRALFKTNAMIGDHAAGGAEMPYDVTGDGQRFIVNERLTPANQSAPLTVVLNWQAALKR